MRRRGAIFLADRPVATSSWPVAVLSCGFGVIFTVLILEIIIVDTRVEDAPVAEAESESVSSGIPAPTTYTGVNVLVQGSETIDHAAIRVVNIDLDEPG